MSLTTPKPRYEVTIHTYGCKVNTYDTGLLQKRFANQAGVSVQVQGESSSRSANGDIQEFGLGPRVPRVHVLNTCAVTAEATREAAKAVRRLKAKDPFAKVVVTGCGAQVDGEVFDQMPGADLIVANSHKGQIENLIDQLFKGELKSKVHRSNIFRKEDLEMGGGVELNHTRAFLKIQDGCNSFCTYCVIPFARGKSRSVPAGELISRINELQSNGVNEVVLTGVHIGDYEDRAGGLRYLHDLVKTIIEKTKVPRIRLSSLEPVELTEELLALYSNSRLCPHFHMSIQSANTKVLKLMRRNYSAEQVESALKRIHEALPNSFVGMDVIAGFPGESEEDFIDSLERLAKTPWTRLHVFPYSERPGTKAAQYTDVVPREVRARRARRLRDLSSERFAEQARAQIGREKSVMVLKALEKTVNGLSRDYWPVSLTGAQSLQSGAECLVKITGFDHSQSTRMDGVLIGQVQERSGH